MEVEPTEPRSCAACGEEVRGNLIIRARWYTYRDPSGWEEWGQICGPCLFEKWRSMDRSWDKEINDLSKHNHAEWQKRVFIKVISELLKSPPTTGIDQDVLDPENYDLKWYVSKEKWYEEWE